jgi:hypothetical protein
MGTVGKPMGVLSQSGLDGKLPLSDPTTKTLNNNSIKTKTSYNSVIFGEIFKGSRIKLVDLII